MVTKVFKTSDFLKKLADFWNNDIHLTSRNGK